MKFKMNSITLKLNNKLILKDINLSVSPGEVMGIIGPNGAGKSSLLKVASGFLKPSNGTVKLDGIELYGEKDQELNSKVGSFIEKPSIYEYLTGREQLDLILRYHSKKNNENIEQLVKKLNMSEYMNKKIKKYSLGMKQRIGLASVLINNPSLVILDEPTNSLDIRGLKELKELILTLKKENKTILISSHMLDEIQEICDKVILLEKGEIIDSFKRDAEIINNRLYGIVVGNIDFILNLLNDNQLSYITMEDGAVEVLIGEEELNDCLSFFVNNNIEIKGINNKNKKLSELYFERI